MDLIFLHFTTYALSWTVLPVVRLAKIPVGARRFVNDWNARGPAHHCAVGVSHIACKLSILGRLLRINVNRVC